MMALRPRCLSTGWPGMPPWLPPLPRSPRQFGFDQGLCLVPSCPASLRRSHEAAALPRPDVTYSRSCDGLAHPSRFAPVARPFERVAQSRACRCISPDHSRMHYHPEVAPGRRQPQATAAAPVPDSRRLFGCPVWPGWLPTHRPRVAQNGVGVPLAPRRHQNRVLSSLAVVALQRRLVSSCP